MTAQISKEARPQYLLTRLMEEAAEVQQAASKIKRFGPNSHDPTHPDRNNLKDLLNELNDFLAIVKMLQLDGIVPEQFEDSEAQDRKIVKTNFFYEHVQPI